MAQFDPRRLARYQNEVVGTIRSTNKLPLFNLPSGTTRVRVLPGMEPGSLEKDFYTVVYLHYNVNPASKIPVICTRTKDPRDYCPVCDRVRELKKSPNKMDQDEASNLSARIKYAIGIVPREGDHAGKAMIYLAPKIIWSKIIQLGEDSEYGDVTDPVEGTDLKFIKTGTGRQNTAYDAIPVKHATPLAETEDEIAELVDNQPEIWRFREVPEKDDIRAFMNGEQSYLKTGLFGVAEAETNTSAEDEAPVPAPRPAPRPAAVKRVVEPDPEPEEEEEEAPAPPPPPAKSRFSNLDAIRNKMAKK